MTEMYVTPVKVDRRRQELDGDAWWRRTSWKSYDSEAMVDGRTLRFHRTGLFRHVATAEDVETGEVLARWRSRGGELAAGDAVFRLRRDGRWKTSWALVEGTGALVQFHPRGWAGGALRVVVPADAAVSRVVLLFGAWVSAGLVQDQSVAVTTALAAAVVAATSV